MSSRCGRAYVRVVRVPRRWVPYTGVPIGDVYAAQFNAHIEQQRWSTNRKPMMYLEWVTEREHWSVDPRSSEGTSSKKSNEMSSDKQGG